MISDRAMTAMRVAATTAHLLPGVGVRVRHGADLLLDVRPVSDGAAPGPDLGCRTATPAQFRCAVARAHRRRAAGEPLTFLGLAEGCEPNVELGTPPGSAHRPGGIERVPLSGRWLWAMASTLGAETAHRLGADLVEAALPMRGLRAMGIRADDATDVSVLYAEVDEPPGSSTEVELLDLFEQLLARWTVHELLDGFGRGVRSGTPEVGGR
jgi:hypothetical protein